MNSTAFWLRMKLLGHDWLMLMGIILGIVVMFWSLNSMIELSEEYSSLPIGVLDYDNSLESEAAVKRMKEIPSLRIIEDKQETLNELLLDEMIYGYFILEAGFEENIKLGTTKHMISAYYLKDTPFVKIISDIVAGEIIYPVSLYKTINHYQKLELVEEKLSTAEFIEYMDELLLSSPDFDFAFDMKIITDREDGSEKAITNQLFYNQIMVGILGVVMGFITMFLMMTVVKEKELSLDQRKRINGFSSNSDRIGTIGYGTVIMGIISVGILLLMKRNISSLTWKGGIQFGFLALLYGVVYLTYFYFLACRVKTVIRYQIAATVTILLTSIFGFLSLLINTDFGGILNFIKIIPNVWFIQGFTDIMMRIRYNLWIPAFGVLLLMIIALNLLSRLMDVKRR